MRIREAILRSFHVEKKSYQVIADTLGIGRATVNRVLRLARETGGLAPRPRGGGNASPIRDEVAHVLHEVILETPDATIEEITGELVRRCNVETSRASVHRALVRLGYSRKKSPS